MLPVRLKRCLELVKFRVPGPGHGVMAHALGLFVLFSCTDRLALPLDGPDGEAGARTPRTPTPPVRSVLDPELEALLAKALAKALAMEASRSPPSSPTEEPKMTWGRRRERWKTL